jgi:hypothetical protein
MKMSVKNIFCYVTLFGKNKATEDDCYDIQIMNKNNC